MKLQNWLRKLPRPVAVMCDGQRLQVGKPPAWTEIASSIEALAPHTVTLLGAGDTVLRSRTMAEPGALPVAAPSAEMSEMQHFANLLAAAYAKSAEGHGAVFDRMVQVIELLSGRLGALETSVNRLLSANARLTVEAAQARADAMAEPEGGGGILGALAEGIAAGQLRAVNAPGKAGAK